MLRRILIFTVILEVAAAVSLKLRFLPYLWIGLVCLVGFALLARASRTETLKVFWLNAAVLAGALGGAEVFFWHRENTRRKPSYSPVYHAFDRELGPKPAPGATRSRLVDGDRVIYDVAYTIGHDGLRISPPPDETADGSILLFGCSFMYGEGLRDEDSLPYRIGLLSERKYEVRNFGFHGYGVHQMYSALASGLVERAASKPPKVVIYQAIPDHVGRAAGLYNYEYNHPRFVLRDDGTILRLGQFFDKSEHPWFVGGLVHQLRKSYVLRLVLDRPRPMTDADEHLWVRLVEESRNEVARRFPGAEFHVLLWSWVGQPDAHQLRLSAQMSSDLQQCGIPVHAVTEMLEGYARNPGPYQLSPSYDTHPSAKANDAIARYVVSHLLPGKRP